MKPQTLPTRIEYGQMLTEKVDQEVINHLQYFIYRREFDTKIMQTPTIADFIPAFFDGEKWNVIEKPEFTTDTAITELSKLKPLIDQYQTALNNVKFSGWSLYYQDNEEITISNDKNEIFTFKRKYEDIFESILAYNEYFVESYSEILFFAKKEETNLPLTERGMEDFNINI